MVQWGPGSCGTNPERTAARQSLWVKDGLVQYDVIKQCAEFGIAQYVIIGDEVQVIAGPRPLYAVDEITQIQLCLMFRVISIWLC